jgi:hypothetical protein
MCINPIMKWNTDSLFYENLGTYGVCYEITVSRNVKPCSVMFREEVAASIFRIDKWNGDILTVSAKAHHRTLSWENEHSPHLLQYTFKIHYNITLPVKPSSITWSLLFRFYDHKSVCILDRFHASYMSRSSRISCFYHLANILWRVRIVKLSFLYKIFAASCLVLSLRSRNSQNILLNRPPISTFPLKWETKFHPHTNWRIKL